MFWVLWILDSWSGRKLYFLFLEVLTSKQMVQVSLLSFYLKIFRKRKHNFWRCPLNEGILNWKYIYSYGMKGFQIESTFGMKGFQVHMSTTYIFISKISWMIEKRDFKLNLSFSTTYAGLFANHQKVSLVCIFLFCIMKNQATEQSNPQPSN